MNVSRSKQETTSSSHPQQQPDFFIHAPVVKAPKGGGAIRGIDEKFAANPVTGTGSLTIPIATSPGRSSFGPQLSLSYDSGAGNTAFGFGWSLSLPSITRKTDKGLPQYFDTEESDVFLLSGAEDLVPTLVEQGGRWVREQITSRTVNGVRYHIQRYRPRIEGLFARIERWTSESDPTHSFWCSISKDNITTWYGKTAASRIADPADPQRIFSWLICETHDDKGNVIVYGYKSENDEKIDTHQANERNRERTANRYLKWIRYGNHTPYLPKLEEDRPWPVPPGDGHWFFEVVFDYGEHDLANPKPNDPGLWPVRNDPFSSYRSGFEIRTYRLCQRALMFHHFPDEPGAGANCLVRSTDFTYSYEEDLGDTRNPIYSVLLSVTHTGYKRKDANSYLARSLPPVEFRYSQVPDPEQLARQPVEAIDVESLEQLPYGLDGTTYQWVDLDGEGISGILTEQGGAWFYKRNMSPYCDARPDGDPHPVALFGPVELLAMKPNAPLEGGQIQLLDLAGDGQLDLATLAGPTAGFYEHDQEDGWSPFRAFTAQPGFDPHDPNLRFVDLDGDGHADVLITEHEALRWHPSLAEAGFGPALRVGKAQDEERGPALVFADATQSIYLADMSGDGLTDLVRIRNGEICYWPNLGYARFGAKVAMDNAPWLDSPGAFDQRRIRLADIDGTGTTDLIYLGWDGVRIYFNQAGNCWSAAVPLPQCPPFDAVMAIQAIDLLGNGTVCLVWSSPLSGHTQLSMHYVDLMGGQKPHLLINVRNNLGAETRVQYAPSTRFYLQDKFSGKPWVTRLPFPVHCVEKVTITDKWRQTAFSTTYSYHHGYFDGLDREFRGFGRVDQVDVESYGEFAQGSAASPYITADKTLYQPPVKTVTWYHTGAWLGHERVLSQFEHEYFPRWLEDQQPNEANVLGGFREDVLPQPDLAAADLDAEEWREAMRACKGMVLRQEVYELDVDALEQGEHRPAKLFSTAYHNCHIERLQAKAFNRHAVFWVAESESITYHYELDLGPGTLRPDPRIAHSLNLKFDQYANVLQTVTVVYPRLGQFENSSLPADALALIRSVQKETHLAYSETRYTDDFVANDNYRLRVPCEVLSYELTGITPEDEGDQATPDRRDNLYFSLEELRRFRLSPAYQPEAGLIPVADLSYHQLSNGSTPEKRLVEHLRILFFNDDAPTPIDPLPFGQLGRLGLAYETYKLTLSTDLLNTVFSDTSGNRLDRAAHGSQSARQMLGNSRLSGYLSGADLAARFAPLPAAELAGQYWIRSGIAGFAPDAAQHFYMPERYIDPFGNVTSLQYDPHDLFVLSTADAVGNTSRVTLFDYRVLAPRELEDINGNLCEVFFDVLGLPAALALKGKGNEGDNLTGFDDALANPEFADLAAFFDMPTYSEAPARQWLGNATARHVYDFGEIRNPDGSFTWGARPACSCGILRERHVSQLAPDEQSPVQVSFEYSDGLGCVIVKKIQAEPETPSGPLRWVASGKTILNNKGKPVKQYEPYFSPTPRFEEPGEEGVTPIVSYDAVGRTVRTELPDGSYSRVEFSPWYVATYDPNDTVAEPGNAWFMRKTGAAATAEEKRAAQLAAEHANTPSLTVLDSLGRDVISVAHNRVRDSAGVLSDEKILTFTKLDTEGKPLWIRDARGNLVMQYIMPPVPNNQPGDPVAGFAPCYDIAGNLLFQHSMDAGDRWVLNDAAGKTWLAWDSRGHTFCVTYDELHRPTGSFVRGADPLDPNREIQFEKMVYGDAPSNGLTDAQKTQLNLRGKPYQQYDTAGLLVSLGPNPATGVDEAFDFKGNPLRSTRRLGSDYKITPDWSQSPALEAEVFTSSTRYDALNRPLHIVAPHSNRPGATLSVIQHGYNEAGLLERVDAWLEQASEPAALLDAGTATRRMVADIDYNAKGQRLLIEYNQGDGKVLTTYTYDPETFRLARLVTTRPNYPEADKRTLQDLSYTYDPVGNITHIRDRAQDSVFHSNACVEPGGEYCYDALYRLVAAAGREHQGGGQQPGWDDGIRIINTVPNDCLALQNYVEIYRYDPVGNILQMAHHQGRDLDGPGQVIWNRRYQYAPDSNRLLATRLPGDPDNLPDYTPAPGYSAQYTYDPHGNMLTMPHLPWVAWDFKDQLRASQRQVVNGGTAETTYYIYDAGGQRIRKITETQTGARKDERIYFGGFEVYRKYGAGAVTLERETLRIRGGTQLVAFIETRTRGADPAPRQLVRYQHGNHLGSAMLELDGQADVISYEEYHPYGSTAYQAMRSQTETPKRYRYTSKERDEETGLYYHGARYYAPWLGRWTSCDPAGLIDGTNMFAYVQANPIRLSDRTGFQAADEWGTWDPNFVASDKGIHGDPGGSGPLSNLARSPTRSSLATSPKSAARSTPSTKQGSQSEAGPAAPPLEQLPPPEPDHRYGFYPLKEASEKLGQQATADLKEGNYVKGLAKLYVQGKMSTAVLGEDLMPYNIPDHFLSAGQYAKRWVWYDRRGQTSRGLLELGKGHMEASSIVGSFEIAVSLTKMAGTSILKSSVRNSVAERGSSAALADEVGQHTIVGQETRSATAAEEQRFLTSLKQNKEVGLWQRADGTNGLVPGQAAEIRLPAGSDVTLTSHTHPQSKVALFSEQDVRSMWTGNYPPNAKHNVIGYKWPMANQVLEALGLPLETGIVTTTIEQSQVMSPGAAVRWGTLGR